MRITKKIVYEINGHVYDSLKKAKEHDENLIANFLKNVLSKNGCHSSTFIGVTEDILKNREYLMQILKLPEVDDLTN